MFIPKWAIALFSVLFFALAVLTYLGAALVYSISNPV